MKKILVLSAALIGSLQILFAQSDSIKHYQNLYKFEIKNDGLVFCDTVYSPDISKASLYARVIEGLYVIYKRPKDIIQMEDKDRGIIIAKFDRVISAEFPNLISTPYILKIEIEDKKWIAKMKVSDYYVSSDYRGPILRNHPFEVINSNNRYLRVSENSFKRMCEGILDEIDRIKRAISDSDF